MKHEDLFRKVSALALSAGISTAVGDMGVGLLIKFLAGLASKYLEELELDKLKAVLQTTHPSDLNHNLQVALQQAINQALTNVQILYADQLRFDHQKEATKKLIKQLRAGVEAALLSPATKTDRGVIELIDTKTVQSADEITQLMDAALAELPAIDEVNPFSAFIRTNFVSQLQLCFGEELKKKQQHEAWVAYQRMLLNQLKHSTEETLAVGREANRKLDELASQQPVQFPRISKQRLAALQELLNTLERTDIRLEDRFQSALDTWVTDLRGQMADVIQKLDRLTEQIIQTDHIVRRFDRTLRQNWVSKYWLALSINIGLVVMIILVVYTYFSSQPFDLTVFAQPTKDLTLAADYPPFSGGELVLRLSNKDERSSMFPHGEVVIKQIPASLRGATVSVRLIARYWRTAKDSVKLNGSLLNLALVPDGSLGVLTGNVRNESAEPVVSAVVHINNDTTILTDRRGIFRVILPYQMQHDHYDLKVDQPGYQPYKRLYYPKSGNIDIRLNQEYRN